MDTPRKVSRSALGICAAAALLHAYQAKGNGGIEIAFPLFMWSIVPYMVPLVLAITGVRHAIAIIAAACAFAFDIYIFVAVHTSQSSTASLTFLWAPVWNATIVVPVAAGGTWLWFKIRGGGQRAF